MGVIGWMVNFGRVDVDANESLLFQNCVWWRMPHVASFEYTMNIFLKHFFNSIADFKLEIAYVPCDELWSAQSLKV